MNLTIRQFTILFHQINVLIELEFGIDIQPRMLSAEIQHKIAMRMFGGKK